MSSLTNLCLLPADSSLQSSVPSRSSSSLKSIFRRYLFKKDTPIIPDHHPQLSVRTFHRRKGFEIVRKIKFNNKKFHSTSNNYDMTILHDDELDNPHLATLRRRKKKIPSWAKKDQLQLAIINQIYFQEINPEDIFGTICIEDIFDMIHSIDITNKEFSSIIVSRHFV